MATYSSPDGATIRDYARLNYQIWDGYANNAALETALAADVADGEDAVFLRIGESYETNTGLSNRQVRCLQRAVSLRTAVLYLREMLVDKTSGTHEPLLMEEADSIRTMIADYEDEAEKWEGLLTGEGAAVDTEPLAIPSITSSTFTAAEGDRTPAERFALIDESDNVASWDLDNG